MRQANHINRRGGRSRNFNGQSSNRESTNRNNFDSNGPNVRVRGKATQVYEKYINLARDASTNGDRVLMENLFQHAEHYIRLANEMNESKPQNSHNNNGSGNVRPPHTHDENDKDKEVSHAEEVEKNTETVSLTEEPPKPSSSAGAEAAK